MSNTFEWQSNAAATGELVDEAGARRLAEEHGLPEVEIDAALFGEQVELAESILSWIDREEGKLTKEHGLIAGRKLYKPVRMLKSYARKYKTGRNRTRDRTTSRTT